MRFIPIILVLLIACKPSQKMSSNHSSPRDDQAKNIILLIGDGMGLTQVSAAIYMNNNTSNIERFPIIGLHKNYSSDNLVTDSAAGATAFASGVKSYNGAIGVNKDTVSVQTILEELIPMGYSTGLIASSSIVHATPASFAAHNKSRQNYEEIASDLAVSGVDIMIGGGKSFFDRRETDDRNLIEEMENEGYVVYDYFTEELDEVIFDNQKYVYLTADKEPITAQAGRDYLIPGSSKAINFLSKKSGDKGFFLMIEGSQIDWAGHANNFEYLIAEMNEYDQVIKLALDFAKKDGETLVILTADHETGGLAINPGSEMNKITAAFTSDKHTATLIPVYAYGPGAEEFAGIYENTEIYNKMRKVLGLGKK